MQHQPQMSQPQMGGQPTQTQTVAQPQQQYIKQTMIVPKVLNVSFNVRLILLEKITALN